MRWWNLYPPAVTERHVSNLTEQLAEEREKLGKAQRENSELKLRVQELAAAHPVIELAQVADRNTELRIVIDNKDAELDALAEENKKLKDLVQFIDSGVPEAMELDEDGNPYVWETDLDKRGPYRKEDLFDCIGALRMQLAESEQKQRTAEAFAGFWETMTERTCEQLQAETAEKTELGMELLAYLRTDAKNNKDKENW